MSTDNTLSQISDINISHIKDTSIADTSFNLNVMFNKLNSNQLLISTEQFIKYFSIKYKGPLIIMSDHTVLKKLKT